MIYFDNAATTYPKPESVIEAVNDAVSGVYGNPGRGGHAAAMAAAELVYGCRVKLAKAFGTDPSRVCFTGGCTAALNTAILGRISPGERVITSDLEHNSVMRPLRAAKAVTDTFSAASDDGRILGQIDEKIKKGAACVVCTCASNVLPVVLPYAKIGALCRKRGVTFIADGAQAAGFYDIDVERDGIDVLCVPSHKGLYGIPGAGALIFSPRADVSRFKPLVSGGTGTDPLSVIMPETVPERFEAGTLPLAAIASMSAGIDHVNSVGTENIRRKVEAVKRAVLGRLSDDGRIKFYGRGPGSLLCFNVEGAGCERIARELDLHGICVRAGLHCSPSAHKYTAPDGTGAVRLSFSYSNTTDEAERFCRIMSRFILP